LCGGERKKGPSRAAASNFFHQVTRGRKEKIGFSLIQLSQLSSHLVISKGGRKSIPFGKKRKGGSEKEIGAS